MITSVFRAYGKGIAAENLDFTSHSLEIALTELYATSHGEMTSKYEEAEITGEDSAGTAYAGKVKTTRTITAKWLSNNGNRITAPSIRRGESVVVWATADHDEFRWTETGDESHHRNSEVVVFGFRASKDYAKKPSLKEDMYVLEVNTERGFVSFNTSAARGEHTTTALYFDLLSGIFSYTDGKSNRILVDAVNSLLTLRNRNGADLGIIGNNAWIKAPTQVVVKAPSIYHDGNVYCSGPVRAADFIKSPVSPPGVFDAGAATPPKR